MRLFSWIPKKASEDVRKFVQQSTLNAIRALPNKKQTEAKWEKQWSWYDGVMKRSEYSSKQVMENLRIIRDLNPDASMAIWNFLRLANNGHEIEAITTSGDLDRSSMDLINSLAPRVGKLYGGGMDQLINVLLLTAFTQGSIALEVELTESIDDVVDFHAVDPSTLDFRRNKQTDEIELVQKQWDGTYKVMNGETVFYYPIDPDIGDPYGRSPILPILQIIFFQIQVMKDLQKVIHHQGYERFDISIVEEAIMENLPDRIKNGSPEEIQRYVTNYIGDVQRQMEQLEPDDDFYHTSSIEIKMVGGARSGAVNAQAVVDIINQQVVMALKQLPILLGRNEGSTETHGTVQWQIYVAGIQSIQRGIKRMLERAYGVSLQVYGRQATAKVTFNELRTSDRQSDAAAEKVETETKIMQVNQGWIDNDEAAQDMVGHDAVGEPITVVQPTAEPTEDISRTSRMQMKRKRQSRAVPDEDEFVKEVNALWAKGVSREVAGFAESTYDALQRQQRSYISRLRASNGIPTRSYIRENKKDIEPSEIFKEWVFRFILIDSSEWKDYWEDTSYPSFERVATFAAITGMEQVSSTVSFDVKNPRMFQYLAQRTESYAKIQDTNDKEVIWQLWEGRLNGEGIEQLARRLENMPYFNLERAYTTARTEILTAARAGNHEGWVQSGVVSRKEWNSHLDNRVRRSHAAAHGQVVDMAQPFIVNGEKLMFPGDSSLGASLENIIMCRCAEIPIVDD